MNTPPSSPALATTAPPPPPPPSPALATPPNLTPSSNDEALAPLESLDKAQSKLCGSTESPSEDDVSDYFIDKPKAKRFGSSSDEVEDEDEEYLDLFVRNISVRNSEKRKSNGCTYMSIEEMAATGGVSYSLLTVLATALASQVKKDDKVWNAFINEPTRAKKAQTSSSEENEEDDTDTDADDSGDNDDDSYDDDEDDISDDGGDEDGDEAANFHSWVEFQLKHDELARLVDA
ncbi:uncharacterized protein LOC133888322 [Phragmites australis]|uniref:uncharacterized protein LOC133888322 n=1 Tax=Phragmites australis TaxID=29695 RepID=UPI002D790605|nr:uncharacterized protein LOC133888322 [Phragmites australis]